MSRRKFEFVAVNLLYLENMMGMAINELYDMKNTKGERVHSFHNFSKVMKHLDNKYNIKCTLKKTEDSYTFISKLYREIGKKYTPLKNHNYSFEPREKSEPLLIKAAKFFFG